MRPHLDNQNQQPQPVPTLQLSPVPHAESRRMKGSSRFWERARDAALTLAKPAATKPPNGFDDQLSERPSKEEIEEDQPKDV